MYHNKFLPYVFALCGLGMVCKIDSPLAYYSGLLLMLIACLIWIKQLERQGSLKTGERISPEDGVGRI